MFFCAKCGSALESSTNPNKGVCPHCGLVTEIKRLKDGSLEFEVYEPYSVQVKGTVIMNCTDKELNAFWG